MTTAILLMLLTGLVWTAVGVLFGAAPAEKDRLYSFFAIGNLFFFVFALATQPPSAAPVPEVLRLSTLIVPSALMEVIAFLFLKRAMERGSQGVAWCVAQSAMVIPFICLVAFMRNPASAAQWAGLASVLVGLALLGREKPRGGADAEGATYILLSLAAFALLGFGQFLRLIPGYAGFPPETMSWRLPLHSLAAALYWVVVCSAKRLWSIRTVWRSAVPYGIVVALGETCFYFAADAADRLLLTSIVMPVSIGTCILLFTLHCRIFRKERLSPGGWIAVGLDIVGIALLSCGRTADGFHDFCSYTIHEPSTRNSRTMKESCTHNVFDFAGGEDEGFPQANTRMNESRSEQSAASGAVIAVSPAEGNATPAVQAAVARLENGGTLRFARGEYHFYEEGAADVFLASVGSSTGMKKVVFHLVGLKDVVIDGGGSSFVFHGNTFPFVVQGCDGVAIRNFTSRVFRLPVVEFTVREKNDEGFLCRFAEGSVPHEVEDGNIFFDLDEGRSDSRESVISVHALRFCHIEYIATPGCRHNKDTLASTFYPVAAEDRGGGEVFFRYFNDPHPKNAGRCAIPLDEPFCLLIGCGRNRSLVDFSDCRDVEVADVDVRSGVAMGIVAEMCENIRILRYRVRPDEGRHISLTADSIFLVDTKGRIEIANSEISWGLDDAMNIHGNYTRLESAVGCRAELGIQHHSYHGYFPYRIGEKVEFSRGKGPEKVVLGRAVVAEFPKPGREAARAAIVFDRDIPADWAGCDVANVSHIPTIWIHDNWFHDFLHIRLSAFADILFERNRLRNGNSVIYHDDLTGYWGECGPAHTLVVRDNDCRDMRRTYFDFCVPFTGRAVLEGNRLSGTGSEDPFRFGAGVAETVELH